MGSQVIVDCCSILVHFISDILLQVCLASINAYILAVVFFHAILGRERTTGQVWLPSFPQLQMRTLTPSWIWKIALSYLFYLVDFGYLVVLLWFGLLSWLRLLSSPMMFPFYMLRSDLKTAKDVDLLGTVFPSSASHAISGAYPLQVSGSASVSWTHR